MSRALRHPQPDPHRGVHRVRRRRDPRDVRRDREPDVHDGRDASSAGIGPYPITCVARHPAPRPTTRFAVPRPARSRSTPAPLTRHRRSQDPPVRPAEPAAHVDGERLRQRRDRRRRRTVTGAPSLLHDARPSPTTSARPRSPAPPAPSRRPTTTSRRSSTARLTITPALADPGRHRRSVNPASRARHRHRHGDRERGRPGRPTGHRHASTRTRRPIAGPLALVGGGGLVPARRRPDRRRPHDITAVYSGDGGQLRRRRPRRRSPRSSGRRRSTSCSPPTGRPGRRTSRSRSRPTLAPRASGVTVPSPGRSTSRSTASSRRPCPSSPGRPRTDHAGARAAARSSRRTTPDVAVQKRLQRRRSGHAGEDRRRQHGRRRRASASSSTSIYPVRDTWKDTVAIRGTRNEAALGLDHDLLAGRCRERPAVKSVSSPAGPAPTRTRWNGRTRAGRSSPAGKYKVVQVLADAYGAKKTYTSYVTLSKKRMYWYTKTITVSPGPRRFSVPERHVDPDPVQHDEHRGRSPWPSRRRRRAPTRSPGRAVGYQFTLPSASTYSSLSFQVQGSLDGHDGAEDRPDPVERRRLGLDVQHHAGAGGDGDEHDRRTTARRSRTSPGSAPGGTCGP